MNVSYASFAVALLGLVVASLALIPAWTAENREQKNQAEEDTDDNGLPLQVSPGLSYYGAPWRASQTSYELQINGQIFQDNAGPAVPGWQWLEQNWTPVSSTGTAVNVLSKHKTTVLVQGVELRDVACSEPPSGGSLFRVPELGDGGEGAAPVSMGIMVDAARPITRVSEGLKLGKPYTDQVALEKGDAREFVVEFHTTAKACTFKADLLVYSKGKKYRLQLPSEWQNDKPSGYTFKVAPPTKKYKSHYIVGERDMIIYVPQEDIKWDSNQPKYTGNGQLYRW
ncbi:hypothetical protein [Streptomyces sp. NPDC002164]|uniref:hypothetical protein n=1 Tax=Streptomyces sp. NPDC002164 TaxID=3364633 RepID=UPI00368499C7